MNIRFGHVTRNLGSILEESERLLSVDSLGLHRSLLHSRLAQLADPLGSAGSELLKFLGFGRENNFAFICAFKPWDSAAWAVRAFSSYGLLAFFVVLTTLRDLWNLA